MYRIFAILLISAFAAGADSAAFAFGKNKVTYNEYDWHKFTSTHLTLYYPRGHEPLARRALRIGEEAVTLIADKLSHELSAPITVVLYPSPVDFQNTHIIPQHIGPGTGGFTELLKRRVVVPFSGSYRQLRHVLTHELVHAFQFDILFGHGAFAGMGGAGGVPLWFMEGLSEYISLGWDATVDQAMRDAVLHGALPTVKHLNELRVPTGYSIYKLGQSLVYFLVERYGKHVPAKILSYYRNGGNDIDNMFRMVTGRKAHEINRAWHRWLKRKYWSLLDSHSFFDEKAHLSRSEHWRDRQIFYLRPVAGPHGKRVAYLGHDGLHEYLAVCPRKAVPDNNPRQAPDIDDCDKVVLGNQNNRYLYLNLMRNRLSWGDEGKVLFFVARSGDRDVMYWYNIDQKKITRRKEFTSAVIQDPYWHPGAQVVVFVGLYRDRSRLYLYDLSKNKLHTLVDNHYEKKSPVYSFRERAVYYLSNRNEARRWDLRKNAVYRYDLADQESAAIPLPQGFGRAAQIEALAVDREGRRLAISARRESIANLYLADIFSSKNIARDLSWRRLTHLHSGVFAPRFFDGGRRVIYNYHRLYGYDIGEIPVDAAVALGEASEPELDLVAYPGQSRSYQNLTGIEYSAKYALKPDIFFLTFGYSKYGLVGFSQMHFSDMLGDEDVYTTLEYSDEDNGPNFQLHYSNKKHRLNWLWGIFREKNFLNVITLANLNEIFYNSSFGTMSLYRYGVYGGLAYPLSKFFRWEGRVTTSRYEEKFLPGWPKEDVSGNLHQVNSGLVFDNTVWGRGHPIYGWRSYIMVEQSLPASPESIELGRLEGDVRRYFALNRRYSLAFRLRGGTLWGEDHGAFLYSLGGYNTIRGHPYRAYYGRHMWLFNAEFRFPFVKKLELGFPPISIGGISGVMFLDMGSVWTGEWHPMEQSDNTFRDIKAGYGMGLRLVVLPFIILRLDFATPWDGRHSKPMKKWDGMFSIGFDY